MTAKETILKIQELQALQATYHRKLGPKLGEMVYGNNIQIEPLLFVLGMTKPTWEKWILAKDVKPRVPKEKLLRLVMVIERAVAEGELPLNAPKDLLKKATKDFIQKHLAELNTDKLE